MKPEREPRGVTTYDVRDRTKGEMISAASVGDFSLEPAGHIHDAAFLAASPAVSPYCLDAARGEVVLVELPEGIDLASAPFLYEAQYRHARRVHTMGIESFIASAAGLPAPAPPLFLHSTGRCGSTLLTRVLGAVADVTTFSEPDIFSQLAKAGRLPASARGQFAAMYDSLLRFFARHQPGAVAFKFRSVACEHADYLATASPGSASVFLSRNAVEVARSYARVTNRPLSPWQLTDGQRRAWSRVVPLVARLDFPLDGYDLMAALWAGPVLRYLESWPTGMWRGAIDYADLLATPSGIVEGLLAGFVQAPARRPLPASLLAEHSQAGSHLAPERAVPDPVLEAELASPDFESRVARSLHRIDRRLRADMTLPGRLRG